MRKAKSFKDFFKAAAKGEAVSIDKETLENPEEDYEIKKEDKVAYGVADWPQMNESNDERFVQYKGKPVYGYGNFHPKDLEGAVHKLGTLIFTIDSADKENFNQFYKEHKESGCKYVENAFAAGAFGSNFSFEFRSNTVGQTTIVRCNCGVECDITSYDMW